MFLEDHVESHLDEAGAANRVLDHSKAACGRKRVTRVRIEARIEGNVVVWRIE